VLAQPVAQGPAFASTTASVTNLVNALVAATNVRVSKEASPVTRSTAQRECPVPQAAEPRLLLPVGPLRSGERTAEAQASASARAQVLVAQVLVAQVLVAQVLVAQVLVAQVLVAAP